MTHTNVEPRKTRELHNHHFDSTIWNDLQFRDDDIIIATYAKSSTTWIQQIIAQMLFGPDPELEVAEMSPWLDLRIPPEGREAADGGGPDAPAVFEDASPPRCPRLLSQGKIHLHRTRRRVEYV
jgi:hypothetical protein